MRCATCDELLADPGARSFLVNASGDPLSVGTEDPPSTILVEVRCSNGHSSRLRVPDDLAAEETIAVPDDAPIARDARIVSGTTEGGRALP